MLRVASSRLLVTPLAPPPRRGRVARLSGECRLRRRWFEVTLIAIAVAEVIRLLLAS